MKNNKQIYLPGGTGQLDFLFKHYNGLPQKILVIGSVSELIAKSLVVRFNCNVELIVEDYESLINSKVQIENNPQINLRLMEYDLTDFQNEEFDLVYAQASISLTKRNKIVKEIKRISKEGAYICIGEIVNLTKEVPRFVLDIYDSSDLRPIYIESIESYYSERGFSIALSQNISESLKEYYKNSSIMLKDSEHLFTDKEKSYYKKLINKISHESNAYLKLGGHKHIGFKILLLQKEKN